MQRPKWLMGNSFDTRFCIAVMSARTLSIPERALGNAPRFRTAFSYRSNVGNGKKYICARNARRAQPKAQRGTHISLSRVFYKCDSSPGESPNTKLVFPFEPFSLRSRVLPVLSTRTLKKHHDSNAWTATCWRYILQTIRTEGGLLSKTKRSARICGGRLRSSRKLRRTS